MNARYRYLFPLLLVLLFAGCASQDSPDAPHARAGSKMRGDELYELLADNTMILDELGQKARLEMYENGSLLAQKGLTEKNDGSWQVKEDQLCIKFRRWGYGDEVCHDVYKAGDEYRQYTSNGVLASRFTVTEGVLNDPALGVRDRAGTKKTQKKMRQAAPETPDVLVEEQPAASSSPAIQEQPADTRDPQAYKRDLRLIYRDMSQNCPGCNLPNIDLSGASLPHANLAGANLKNSNFSKANLKWVNLKGALLTGANLREADLSGADLAGADMDGADLTGAILNRTNLRGAKIDTTIGINLTGAIR